MGNDAEIERIVGRIVFDALRQSNPRALIDGDPADRPVNRVLIDGTFSFPDLSRLIVAELRKRSLLNE
jgi:hypothetical protein